METKQTFPTISILIPIRNEAGYISRCLSAVVQQDYPPEKIEILVADGTSTDSTRDIIRSFQQSHPNISLIDNPGQVVPTGMNILIPHAKGEILIRVDGHCVITPNYVPNCVRHLQQDGVDGVGGPMHTIGEGFISKVIAMAMSSKFGVGNSSFRTETGKTKLVDTVPFPAYTRAIIRKVGLYDEDMVRNQDDEYNLRIREAGGRILLADDVRSDYYTRGSLIKTWDQFFQYGYWKVRVLQKHPKQMSLRHFVPFTFVLSLFIAMLFPILTFIYPSLRMSDWSWIPFVGLIGIYSLVNLIAGVITAFDQGEKKMLLLPVTYAIIHISYGLGFFVGLFRFWNCWKNKQGHVPQLDWVT